MGRPAHADTGTQPPRDAAGAAAAPVATSAELRRAALERSAQRNAEVARRRVRRRWLAWALYKLLLWSLPLLILAELAWALWLRDHPLPPALKEWLGSTLPAVYPPTPSPSAAAGDPTIQGAP
jgi:hypothetical protein